MCLVTPHRPCCGCQQRVWGGGFLTAETCWEGNRVPPFTHTPPPGTPCRQEWRRVGLLQAHHQAKHREFHLLFQLHFPPSHRPLPGLHKIPVVYARDSALWKILMSDLCRPSILSFLTFQHFSWKWKMQLYSCHCLNSQWSSLKTSGDLVYGGFDFW